MGLNQIFLKRKIWLKTRSYWHKGNSWKPCDSAIAILALKGSQHRETATKNRGKSTQRNRHKKQREVITEKPPQKTEGSQHRETTTKNRGKLSQRNHHKKQKEVNTEKPPQKTEGSYHRETTTKNRRKSTQRNRHKKQREVITEKPPQKITESEIF